MMWKTFYMICRDSELSVQYVLNQSTAVENEKQRGIFIFHRKVRNFPDVVMGYLFSTLSLRWLANIS